MNPNAKEFVFRASAPSWTPSFSAPPPQPPAREPEPEPVAVVENTVAAEEDVGEDDIDEDDPLWKATLKLTLGDREKAMKMLEDPDSLMQYPEIKKIMESTEGDTGDWEESTAQAAPEVEKAAAPAPAPAVAEVAVAAAPSPAKKEGGVAVDGDDQDADEEITTSNDVLTDGDPREHLNLVFIGHVDAGKSTLSGSILYLMGKVDTRTIERFEREAKQRNRESWFLAFIMDTSEEERAKGKTVEVGRAHFETDVNRYTILDAPGHKNYVPNMISGAAQADVGVLVISARKGEFETGFEKGGQTREHALLARTLGVAHLIVVINKMDDPTVNWEQARYDECVSKLKPYLKQVGYTIKKDVKFIPISAISGDNVRDEVPSSRCAWWKDMYTSGGHNTFTPTLISTLNSLTVEGRNPEGALRVPCLDRYFERGTIVLGKVECGTLRVGDEVVIMPTRKRTKVDEVVIGESKVRSAKPGENVLVKFSIAVEDIQKGYVICAAPRLCPAVLEIKVQLALVEMLEHRPVFTPGYDAVMHVHTVEIEVTCVKLISVMIGGKALARPYARNGQVCVARLAMPLHTCMEVFEKMPALGRITLRDEGRTIAIGKILELYKDRPTAGTPNSGSTK